MKNIKLKGKLLKLKVSIACLSMKMELLVTTVTNFCNAEPPILLSLSRVDPFCSMFKQKLCLNFEMELLLGGP